MVTVDHKSIVLIFKFSTETLSGSLPFCNDKASVLSPPSLFSCYVMAVVVHWYKRLKKLSLFSNSFLLGWQKINYFFSVIYFQIIFMAVTFPFSENYWLKLFLPVGLFVFSNLLVMNFILHCCSRKISMSLFQGLFLLLSDRNWG